MLTTFATEFLVSFVLSISPTETDSKQTKTIGHAFVQEIIGHPISQQEHDTMTDTFQPKCPKYSELQLSEVVSY